MSRMAGVRSLGIHVPSGVDHLVEEKVLPQDPAPTAYSWQVFEDPQNPKVFNELVVAGHHVVWSRGNRVHRVFSFEVEKEPVQQALFAFFTERESDGDTLLNRPSGKPFVRKRVIYTPKTPKTPKTPLEDVESIPAPTEPSAANDRVKKVTTDRERALVVLLKSHMQIFFQSGSQSLVPLRFDVDKVLALPEGLIIQRKVWQTPQLQQSQLPPKTPLNSFAFPSSFIRSPETLRLPSNAVNPQQEPALVKALFKSVISGHEVGGQSKVPSHYHLLDPYSELGVLSLSRSSASGERDSDRDELLSCSENLVYVSPDDELSKVADQKTASSLTLAVSVNSSSRQLNVWQVLKPRAMSYWKPRRRLASYDMDRKKRRRSSQPGTGAATPNQRHSIGPRESHVGLQDSITNRDQPKDDEDLAAKLDPAFQNPRAPGPTTRRISSMLARSDLTGSDMYNDGIPGAVANSSFRRDHTLGNMPSGGRSYRQPQDRADLRASLRSESGLLEDDLSNSDDDSDQDTREQLRSLISSTKGLRVDYRLRLMQSVSVEESVFDGLKVFTVGLNNCSDESPGILLYAMDHTGGQLLHFEISVALNGSAYELQKRQKDVHARVVSFQKLENVTDADVYRTGKKSGILIIQPSEKGMHELSVRLDRSTTYSLKLPDRLLINYPHSIGANSFTRKKRLTGPKRLIDDLPLPLKAANRGPSLSQIVIEDRDGILHRLQLQIEPQNSLVKRCLEACYLAIWPVNSEKKDIFALTWTRIHQFLDARADNIADNEWAAFNILVLMLCRPPSAKKMSQSSARSRRKGSLLRSSSGTSIDLADFHEMIALETRQTSAMPLWFESSSWSWALQDRTQTLPSTGLGLDIPLKRKGSYSDVSFNKTAFLTDCILKGQNYVEEYGNDVIEDVKSCVNPDPSRGPEVAHTLSKVLLVALHLLREEFKMNMINEAYVRQLTPLLAQLGGWLGWEKWSWRPASVYAREDVDLSRWIFEESGVHLGEVGEELKPPLIFDAIAQFDEGNEFESPLALAGQLLTDDEQRRRFRMLLPRLQKVHDLVSFSSPDAAVKFQNLDKTDLEPSFIEGLPEGIAAPLRSSVALAQSNPARDTDAKSLNLIDREDLAMLTDADYQIQPAAKSAQLIPNHRSLRDSHAICKSATDDDSGHVSKTNVSIEVDRSVVTRMVFKEDQRVQEANKLLHPLEPPVTRCIKDPEWSEQDFLEAEQEVAKVVAVRTLSVCAGRGLLLYGARSPLLTEKFPTHGFTLSCVMKPSNNHVTADKEVFTEEKVSWAFFHAGAEAGLSISKNSKGIDTSWIVFNKPLELNNRHAGFLLALGLNGHLQNIAKWVAYKYLTPKHTMTSIGLLLGLAASYLGTMNTLIVRLLSVHVTRMLPPGAAELNLSPLTQTTGILALGLLYCNTQHRRMSEIMLSEMENVEEDDNENPLDNLRDEGYRLAAGFALGYINLGQGKNLRGLRDMQIVERLLSLAISTKQVDLVHVLDKASAAATIAVALIFMKSEDEALARKIDIPDTVPQFEYVRPDLFLLRTVARHLIMWNGICATDEWFQRHLPPVFKKSADLKGIDALDIKDLPLYNTIAGMCFSIGLRFAGTSDHAVRDLLLRYLDQFIRLAKLPTASYDQKLTRTTIRNCQDATALAASCVMAGTGDVAVLRRLRSLHGRIDPETPYGSHMATHQAIGTLFLAGGTHTFKSSNLAVASLLCAFYPLFPSSVLDNKGHLQAFRHLWVFAAEPRCLVVRSVDSHKPISVPVSIWLDDGKIQQRMAPCLLPMLDRIESIELDDPRYWRVSLDLASNVAHRAAFARHQSIFARRKAAGVHEQDTSPFSVAVQSLTDDDLVSGRNGAAAGATLAQTSARSLQEGSAYSLEWIFELPYFRKTLAVADRSLALPPPEISFANDAGTKSSSVDDQLMLWLAMDARRADRLWSLRILFAWADRLVAEDATKSDDAPGDGNGDGGEAKAAVRMGWLDGAVVSSLKAELAAKMAEMERGL